MAAAGPAPPRRRRRGALSASHRPPQSVPLREGPKAARAPLPHMRLFTCWSEPGEACCGPGPGNLTARSESALTQRSHNGDVQREEHFPSVPLLSFSCRSSEGGPRGALPQPRGCNGGNSEDRRQRMERAKSLFECRLLDRYALQEMLGQGSYGVVFACRSRSSLSTSSSSRRSSKEKPKEAGLCKEPEPEVASAPAPASAPASAPGWFAVKLIDKVESAPEDIDMEVKVHMKLDHPNILKVHEVIDEKCFVCLVTDLCRGGDVLSCSQASVSSKPHIFSSRLFHLSRQMLNAIVYIHSLSIVHRDIKGENYLLDTKSIIDGRCHVVLADFGFACECRLGERLHRRCGTMLYWSPEFWDGNYALKVDTWAVGVTIYGLVDGTVPFQTEWEVKNMKVVHYLAVSSAFEDLVNALLCKSEGKRCSAARALEHSWFSDPPAPEEAWSLSKDRPLEAEGIRAELPDLGVAERRRELVERLTFVQARADWSRSCSFGTSESLTAIQLRFCTDSFKVFDKRASKMRTFEWWPVEKGRKEGVLSFATECDKTAELAMELSKSRFQVEIVAQILEDFGVDVSSFGKGSCKTLERLAKELESGASRLMLDAARHKSLVRVVDVVLLRFSVRARGTVLYMVVSSDEQFDGRRRPGLNRLPGTKKEPYESVRNAVERVLKCMHGFPGSEVDLDIDNVEVFEVEEESPSFPLVRTVYRKEIVPVFLGSAGQDLIDLPVLRSEGKSSIRLMSWLTEEECLLKGVKLHAPTVGTEVSSLVPPPIGLKLEALARYLKDNNIDPSRFGEDNTKSLKELSDELLVGECALVRLEPGKVARVVDLVLLRILRPGRCRDASSLEERPPREQLLVATREAALGRPSADVVVNRLPGSKRRPHENQFFAAKRVLHQHLGLGENCVDLDAGGALTLVEEKESPSYPGLRTIYRKCVISVELDLLDRRPCHSNPLSAQAVAGDSQQACITGLLGKLWGIR